VFLCVHVCVYVMMMMMMMILIIYLSAVLVFVEATYRLTLGCHGSSILSFLLIFTIFLFF
jgi:hypothetical protein